MDSIRRLVLIAGGAVAALVGIMAVSGLRLMSLGGKHEVVPLAPGVYGTSVTIVDGGVPGNNYAYLFDSPGGVLVVDAGAAGSLSYIEEALQEMGRTLTDVRVVVITHWHNDHTGGLPELLAAAPNATCYLHPADRETLLAGGQELQVRGFYMHILAAVDKAPRRTTVPPVDQHSRIIGLSAQELSQVLQPWGVQAIFTPGHTNGSTSYWHEGEQLLCCGDTLFYLGAPTSPYISAPGPESRELADQQGLNLLLELQPRRLLASHALPTQPMRRFEPLEELNPAQRLFATLSGFEPVASSERAEA